MRNPKRKTSKGSVPGDVMEAAAKRVCAGQSVRDVADESGIPKTTLHRYVAKMNTEESPRFTPNYFVNRVFSEEEEKSLSEYLLRASKHHHGLTSKETRVLAYEYAVRNKKKFPSGWNETKSATYDWLYGFMKRNPSLSIHSPEATSLSRSTTSIQSSLKLMSLDKAEANDPRIDGPYSKYYTPYKKFDPEQTRMVVTLTYQRCGSSFFGQLFNTNPDVFYLYEPLDALYTALYGADEGWNVPSDITNFGNGTE
ncbi:hypothetical protein CAPTEDRAFT_212477, partial [Capitella teleta]